VVLRLVWVCFALPAVIAVASHRSMVVDADRRVSNRLLPPTWPA
jgi:hypothetical protein